MLKDNVNPEALVSFSPCRRSVSSAATAAILVFFFSSSAFGQASSAQAGTALVKQYCAGCHSAKARAGNLALEGLDLAKIGDDAAVWEKVLRKVGAKQMPPLNAPHPEPAAQKQFLTYLETELDKSAAARPNPGRATIHRLNRSEYSNAIRDLFALDVRAGNTLPVDDTGYGFDNIGDVLSLSPVLLERYLTASRMVSRLAVADTDLKPEINIYELGRAGRGGNRNESISEDLPFGSGAGLSFTYTFPVDAEYNFKVRMPAGAAGFGEAAAPVGQVLEIKVPVKAGVRHVGLTFMRSNAVPETLPVFGNGRGGGGGAGGGAWWCRCRCDGAPRSSRGWRTSQDVGRTRGPQRSPL